MIREEETRRAAMKTEEAALLPAMSRGGSGTAAYRSVKRAADRMLSLRLMEGTEQTQKAQETRTQTGIRRNRAALRHVLRR